MEYFDDVKSKEQSRITLSAIFVATYLTIIFGFSDEFKITLEIFSVISQVFFMIFVAAGVIIALLFFLYLVFTALSLSSYRIKEIVFEQTISDRRLEEVKKKLFDWGVRSIFLSFTYPIYYFAVFLVNTYGLLIGGLLDALCLVLVYIALYMLFKD